MNFSKFSVLLMTVLLFQFLGSSSASAQTWTANPAPVLNGNYYYKQIGVDATFDWGSGSQAYGIDIYIEDPAIPRQVAGMAAPILTYDRSMSNKLRIYGNVQYDRLVPNGTALNVIFQAKDLFGNVLGTKTVAITVRQVP